MREGEVMRELIAQLAATISKDLSAYLGTANA